MSRFSRLTGGRGGDSDGQTLIAFAVFVNGYEYIMRLPNNRARN